jgi:hypothetical protein
LPPYEVGMAKYKLRLDIETEPPAPSHQRINWKSLAVAFVTSLAAGIVVALLL